MSENDVFFQHDRSDDFVMGDSKFFSKKNRPRIIVLTILFIQMILIFVLFGLYSNAENGTTKKVIYSYNYFLLFMFYYCCFFMIVLHRDY